MCYKIHIGQFMQKIKKYFSKKFALNKKSSIFALSIKRMWWNW